jgi:hypothetical protein
MDTKPTHEQAHLHLQVFEMRREARLRQAREWFFKNFFADTLEEGMRIAAPGSENGTLFMMVLSYWEQACALLNAGLLHDELFFKTSGEFFGVWERIKGGLPEARKMFAYTQHMAEMEKAAQRYEAWMESHSPGHIAAMREWSKKMRAQMQSKAA